MKIIQNAIFFAINLILFLGTSFADLSHFSAEYPKTTGSSCLYAGKVFINDEKAIDGEDEVGVFVDDGNGGEMLIGADNVKEIAPGYSGYYTFEIYGDNANTDEKDGAKVDDVLISKYGIKALIQNILYLIQTFKQNRLQV
ncbi:MAG: hypothetical protein OMM_12531 [Candidatus Magnetoglobus multicellularis str. Araruama]|uniref:Uncharacterized protein n=1 Tax=Candidatus Magnetoglobus multicellularis str. Araruama TaxID=890399 RepID=A0A1V1NVQ8_9BACT|nr:MAG: hypothetical protein OMM_12531 [Candidatus Magnetoglobus multicellularis str. Araruama]